MSEPSPTVAPAAVPADPLVGSTRDPYLSSGYSLSNRVRRQLWSLAWIFLYRPSPRVAHAWRAKLLRIFGATLGPHCHFYPASRVWAPWNLTCEDAVLVADGVEIYNPSSLTLASHAVLSQGAFLCGATHNYNDSTFPVISFPMRIGRYAWVAARASVSPGVNVGDGAVLGLASVATKNLEPWSIYAGVPARKIKDRTRFA